MKFARRGPTERFLLSTVVGSLQPKQVALPKLIQDLTPLRRFE